MQIGDLVRLKDKPEEGTAHIETEYGSSTKGGVRLDRQLDGFYSWNVDDLEPALTANESVACPECGFGWNDFPTISITRIAQDTKLRSREDSMDTQEQVENLVDLGIAICECGDFLVEHGDDGECFICPCRRFQQDVDSDSYYARALLDKVNKQ